jgi:hypothetical protein
LVVVLLQLTAKQDLADRCWHRVELVYFGQQLLGRRDLRVCKGQPVSLAHRAPKGVRELLGRRESRVLSARQVQPVQRGHRVL